MEETIGALWDKLVTKMAYSGFPEARVELSDITSFASIIFQAVGGDAGLQLQTATAQKHGAQLPWLQRLAGIGMRSENAWYTEQYLFLPSYIDCFPEKELNRDLYVWLLLILANDVKPDAPYLQRNQAATCAVLHQFPQMAERYQRLVQVHLAVRQAQGRLTPKVAQYEQLIAQALLVPGSVQSEVISPSHMLPVVCWIQASATSSKAHAKAKKVAQHVESASTQVAHKAKERKKHAAQYTDMPKPESPFMLLFRAESLFSWAEYVKVNRDLDEDDNPDADKAANDLDFLSVANDGKSLANRLRFDLDLPSEADDDIILTQGLRYPEWNYKKNHYHEAHVHVEMMIARKAEQSSLPMHLQRMAQQLRRQFQSLQSQATRLHAQAQGDEIDIDACVRFFSAPKNQDGLSSTQANIYHQSRCQERDLACLLLADLSMSTDAAINNQQRVVDVIRDSLYLFSEALSASGDKFALYGFSSVRRHHVRMHLLKGFDEHYRPEIRARLAEIKPGFYTRMGAAIRHSTALLKKQAHHRRLLFILTDGKPNDLDQYEGRYGIEDTRVAIQEARDAGLIPFCVTIDDQAHDYLPHIFGHQSYVVVSHAADLPLILPRLYRQITAR